MSENTAPWAGTPATNNARVSATPTVTRRVIPDLLGHIRKCPFGGLRRRRRGLDLVPPSGAGERTPAHHRGEFLDRPAACGRQRATLARDPMGGKTPSYNDPIVHYPAPGDRKSTRLNSSHVAISYAVFCLKKKKKKKNHTTTLKNS